MEHSKRYIINADDFGFNKSINHAIIRSFSSGYIDSASIMVGTPGFDDAVALFKEHKLINKIGIHLNVTEGYPTTNLIKRIPSLVDKESGRFLNSLKITVLRLPSHDVTALKNEFSHQIETCLKVGIIPSHIDSHHHIHNIWPIGRIFIDLAREYSIPNIRIARNMGQGINFKKRVYKVIYNMRLRYYGFARSTFMGSFTDVINEDIRKNDNTIEIMVHPDLKNEVIVDQLEKRPLKELIEEVLKTPVA